MQQQMQMQSSSQCKGGKCNKPGNGKPKLSDMSSQQKSLKQQIESLLKQYEQETPKVTTPVEEEVKDAEVKEVETKTEKKEVKKDE